MTTYVIASDGGATLAVAFATTGSSAPENTIPLDTKIFADMGLINYPGQVNLADPNALHFTMPVNAVDDFWVTQQGGGGGGVQRPTYGQLFPWYGNG